MVIPANPDLEKGREWKYENLTFIIREKEEHRIRKLEVVKHGPQDAEADSNEGREEPVNM